MSTSEPLLHTASAKNMGNTGASTRQLGMAGIPNQLGTSGIASANRSAVTKTFLAGQQGGFDVQDPHKGLEKSVLSAARPGNVASVITNMMDEEATEDVHHLFGCMSCWNGIPITNNVKALIIMMVMFAVISIGQYFAADYCGSQALKADVVSMGVDAVSYLGNILGEASDVPAQRIVLQLVFSAVSIALLLYFNTMIIRESIDGLRGIETEGEPPAANPDAEGTIVIVFAGLGLTFDFVCLYAYWYFAKKDAQIEYEAMRREAELRGEDVADLQAKIQRPHINMFSALIHVSADLFRSTSTFVLGVLMVTNALDQDQSDQGDGILAVIISSTIYLAAATALYEWLGTMNSWYAGLGQAIEVACPEGIEPGDIIRIEPTKAGHGKAADAFMG